MEFIEAPDFTHNLPRYLDDEDLRLLQMLLVTNPQAGEVMANTGGFRKMRWHDPRRRKGKRGGLRIIYYHFPKEEQIWLLTLYGKDEMEDLSAKERGLLREAIEREKRARKQAAERSGRRKQVR